jgi:hypothetical protein
MRTVCTITAGVCHALGLKQPVRAVHVATGFKLRHCGRPIQLCATQVGYWPKEPHQLCGGAAAHHRPQPVLHVRVSPPTPLLSTLLLPACRPPFLMSVVQLCVQTVDTAPSYLPGAVRPVFQPRHRHSAPRCRGGKHFVSGAAGMLPSHPRLQWSTEYTQWQQTGGAPSPFSLQGPGPRQHVFLFP